MKTISKRFLKGGLAILLAVMMLFSSTITGFAAVVDNAQIGAQSTVPKNCRIIFDNSASNWSDTYIYFVIGHNSYSSLYRLNKIDNTNLYTGTVTDKWEGATYYAIMGNGSSWGSGNWGPSNLKNANHYTKEYTSEYGLTSTSGSYVFKTAGSADGTTLSIDYVSAYSGYNTTQTATVQSAAFGSSDYLDNADAGSTTISTYKLSSFTASTSSTGTASASAARTATVTMTATANDGYTFVGWYNSSGTQQTTNTTLTYTCNGSAATYYARFQQSNVSYTVTAAASYSDNGDAYNPGTTGGTVNITVGSEDRGTSATVDSNTEYTLNANAADGYRFVGWFKGNDSVSTEASYTTNTTADVTYTAKFVKTHKVTVNFTAGIESIEFNGIPYNQSFNNVEVDAGAIVTVNASPATGYKFLNWTVVGATVADNTTENLTVSNIQSDLTLTANAVPVYTASATAQTNKYHGTYGGTVTIDGQSSPVEYEVGDKVKFKATNNTNYYFDGWYTDAEFTNRVSTDAEYQATMTADGITLYALFVKNFYLTSSADERLATFVYNVAENSYSVKANFADNFTITSNDNNDVNATDVTVIGGTHIGCTVDGDASGYTLEPDTENFSTAKPVTYTLTPDFNSSNIPDGTYTMNITLQAAEKVEISVNGEKVAEKAIGSTFSYEITAPAGQYLSGATTDTAVNFEIVDGKIEFTVPETNVNIVPVFANYSYVKISDTTGLDITGLKTGYKAGERVEITLEPASDATTITNVVADNDVAVIVDNGNGTWTVTIASMPADTTITLTPTVDAKFVMNYGTQVAIGNYGTGVTSGFGTVKMTIGDTELANGGYAAPTDTVKYTATETNENYVFAGFYSDAACENVLSYESTYEVKPTKDTTVYTLWARRQYMDFDSSPNTNIVKELTYNKEDRVYTLSTVLADDSGTNAISKGAWFQVTNDMNSWTTNPSYHHFGSEFSVSHNSNSFDATISWNDGGDSWKLSTSAANDTAITFILTPTGNTAIDFSAQVGEVGDLVYLSSGRLDLPGSYNATAFEANIKFTHIEESANPDDTYVANEGENREKYKRLNLSEAQTVSFEVEITGTRAVDYEVDSFVVYHIDTETYTIVTPTTLGNNKYSGSVYVDGPCYIVPIYFLTEKYAADNNLAEIDIYFDATAIKDKAWGPFVACYAWGSNDAEYNGGWSGQMMIPTPDGLSFYTMLTVPKATAENPPSVPQGVTFNNYLQSTVPGSNAGAFGITSTQYQCYDYREPITLYELGYEVITFVAKDSTDGYHGDHANGVTPNPISEDVDIFENYDFEYLYSRDGKTPMDLTGQEILNAPELSDTNKADYYVVNEGDLRYYKDQHHYQGDPSYEGEWTVEWWVFDSEGNYKTNIISDAFYNDIANGDGTTYLQNALGLTKEQAAGKSIAISYEHENNYSVDGASHQISYDGQWYGNMLDHTIKADVLVGLVNADGTAYTIDTDNIADYGEGYVVDENGDKHQSLDITLDVGRAVLNAASKEGYRFIGWHTLQPDGTYKLVSPAFDFDPYISGNTTYYAIFKQIQSGEVVINHAVYKNTDPAITDHGGVSEMSIEVYNSTGVLVSSSTPSTSRSTTSFEGSDGQIYTIKVITTPLMNGQFFAWYTDSLDANNNKTYEEVLTEDKHIGSTSQVYAEFEYTFDNQTSLKTINIYSDVRRVSNKAILIYKYINRNGEPRTYTVKDVLLSDEECTGFKDGVKFDGNDGKEYCPAYRTLCTFTKDEEEHSFYFDEEEVEEEKTRLENDGFTFVSSYNKIQAYAPNEDVTQAFNQTVVWEVESTKLGFETSEITLTAKQAPMTFTIKYEMNGKTSEVKGNYNDLVQIEADSKDSNGNKFAYWVEILDNGTPNDTSDDTEVILTYLQNYNYRIVEDKKIKAVYLAEIETEEVWTPSINSVTITREYHDNGDIIYNDYLLAFNNNKELELNQVKENGERYRYGLMLVRDKDYFFGGTGAVVFVDDTQLKTELEAVARGGTSTVVNDEYNVYCYDLTGTTLTNLNRIDYVLRYDNTKLVSQTHYYREYAFTAVPYVIDVVNNNKVYLGNSEYVNFFKQATANVESNTTN